MEAGAGQRREELAPGVSLLRGDGWSELRAVDQSAGFHGTFVAGLLGIHAGYLHPAGFIAGPLLLGGLSFLLTRSARVRLRLERDRVHYSRRLLGLSWKRVEVPMQHAEFEVTGTGDWGLRGDWPLPEVCELRSLALGLDELPIGPGAAAVQICIAIHDELNRLGVVSVGRRGWCAPAPEP